MTIKQDIEQLERIKVLRVLGVPISDIRELKDGKLNLEPLWKTVSNCCMRKSRT